MDDLPGASQIQAQRPTFRRLIAIAQFRALIIGFLLHLASGTVATLAISVLVYEQSHSTILTAIALASNYLPHIIGTTSLLSLADRLPTRNGLAFVSIVQVLMFAVVALGLLPIGAVLAVVLIGGIAQPIGTAIRSAALPEIVGDNLFVLGRAVLNMTSYSAQALGYAVGGVCVLAMGTGGALWVATAASVIVMGINWFGLENRAARSAATGSAVRQTWKTNGLLLRTRSIRGLVLAYWLPLALASSSAALFIPYAARFGGAPHAGALFWALTAGSVAGDLVVGRLASQETQARLAFPLALLLAVPLLFFILQPPLPIAVGLCFLSATGISYQLGLQRRFLDAVPPMARAQALGLVYGGIPALLGITLTVGGALATILPPGKVIVLFGLASGLSTLALAAHIREQPAAVAR